MMWEADESHDLWDDEPRNRINRATAGDATDRFVTGNLTSEDLDVERSLRPQRLDDYCGQGHIKDSLRILIQAAQTGRRPFVRSAKIFPHFCGERRPVPPRRAGRFEVAAPCIPLV